MKKALIVGGLLFLLLVTVVLAASLTREQKLEIRECRKDCNLDRREVLSQCRSDGKQCTDQCRTDYNACRNGLRQVFQTCQGSCNAAYQAALQLDLSREDRRAVQKEFSFCKRACYKNYTADRREQCDISNCRRSCTDTRRACTNAANTDYRFCSNECRFMFEENITCENGNYTPGQVVARGCETCECGFDGKMHCSTHAYCNFNEFEFERAECEAAGGFYQELCFGNIYAMRCSNEFYCQCGGNANFTCPTDSICLEEFKPDGILRGNLKIWSDRGGRPLGDIGICAQLPDLPHCGNGVCDNIVCTAQGCPEPETHLNCPIDCS